MRTPPGAQIDKTPWLWYRKARRMLLDTTQLPRHVAIIMDGNGRWAQAHGLPRVEGHRQGAKAVREVVRAAREIGVRALQLLRDYVIEERDEIMENGIRLTAIGEVERLPPYVKEPLDALVRESAGNRDMTLCLALSYGGRESIVAAARALAEAVARGELVPEEVSEERFAESLQTGELPPLDLLVRTSGEERLSNFLLWEAAYAELYFTDTYWPAFGKAELYQALESFRRRERRFGRTREQIRSVG